MGYKTLGASKVYVRTVGGYRIADVSDIGALNFADFKTKLFSALDYVGKAATLSNQIDTKLQQKINLAKQYKDSKALSTLQALQTQHTTKKKELQGLVDKANWIKGAWASIESFVSNNLKVFETALQKTGSSIVSTATSVAKKAGEAVSKTKTTVVSAAKKLFGIKGLDIGDDGVGDIGEPITIAVIVTIGVAIIATAAVLYKYFQTVDDKINHTEITETYTPPTTAPSPGIPSIPSMPSGAGVPGVPSYVTSPEGVTYAVTPAGAIPFGAGQGGYYQTQAQPATLSSTMLKGANVAILIAAGVGLFFVLDKGVGVFQKYSKKSKRSA